MNEIRIYVDGQQLNVVKETLTINEASSSFTDSFEVPHSNNPFLIRKDKVSEELLDINSFRDINRRRVVDCRVQEGSNIYNGQLVVRQVFRNTIKCDVSHYSQLFNLMTSDIRQYMPVVSVINDPAPDPYVETSVDEIDDQAWEAFSLSNKYNSFPANDFCLPWIERPNLFGEELEEGDEWFFYGGRLNSYFASTGEIVRNFFSDGDFDADASTPDTRLFVNRNVVVPCVFILSPLVRALESLGYKLSGAATTDKHIQSTFLLSDVDQMTAVGSGTSEDVFSFDGLGFLPGNNYRDVFGNDIFLEDRVILIEHPVNDIGQYEVVFDVDASNAPFNGDVLFCALSYIDQAGIQQTHLYEVSTDAEGLIQGSFTFTATPEHIGGQLQVRYIHLSTNAVAPQASTITINFSLSAGNVHRIHPTIELSRYIPDWTVARYLNEIKRWLNLEITVDDSSQTVFLNYNETRITRRPDPIQLENYYNRPFIPNENDSYVLRYAEADGERLYIDTNGESPDQVGDEFTRDVEFAYKKIPHNGITSLVSEEFMSGDGEAIGMFDTAQGLPYTTAIVDDRSLDIIGPRGLYQNNFRIWIRFRIRSSQKEIRIPTTFLQLQEIKEKGELFLDNQLYLVSRVRSTSSDVIYDAEITLESVVF